VELHWADAKLLSDPPDKLRKPAGATSETYLGAQFTPYADAVRSELLVVSAYFVPGKKGIEFFGGKGRTGTAIRILTNSLAATDVWLVHASYKKYRRPLLEAGVRLYELKAEAQGDAGVKGLIGSSRSSLHGKTFVLDRRKVFVGSVNIDPRSLAQNTEVGVLVDSPALSAEVAALFERWANPSVAYEVVLTGERRTQLGWIGSTNGKQVQLTSEPDAGFWRRLGANVFAMLPIESLV
jgi:putative cardiolipin synthase